MTMPTHIVVSPTVKPAYAGAFPAILDRRSFESGTNDPHHGANRVHVCFRDLLRSCVLGLATQTVFRPRGATPGPTSISSEATPPREEHH
jgi:hypothetical protein